MRYLFLGFIWLFVWNAGASQNSIREKVGNEKLALIFDSTPIANLTFHLDCMAELIHCEAKAITPFWKTSEWSSADDAALKSWEEMRDKYLGFEIRLPEVSPEKQVEIGFPLRHTGVSFDQKFRIVGFSSNDIEEYHKNLGFLMSPSDADRTTEIVRRFYPRFMKWWKESGFQATSNFIRSSIEIVKKNEIFSLFEKSMFFYRSEISSSSEVLIHYILLPQSSGHSGGEQIENHGVVEFMTTEKPEDRMSVICHEIFHYLYSLASSGRHFDLVSFFLKSKEPHAIPAYNLLNEVFATAFGNGMVDRTIHSPDWFQKKVAKEQSFYKDHAIDGVAKKILPFLDSSLEKGRTLYDGDFLKQYLVAVKEALPVENTAPALVLRTSSSFYEDFFRKEYREFLRKIHSGSTTDTTNARSDFFPKRILDSKYLSGLIILRPKNVNFLEPWAAFIPKRQLDEIKNLTKQGKPFLYPVPRSQNATIYVVVASTGSQAENLLGKLVEAQNTITQVVF